MKNFFLISGIALLVAGCATPNDLRAKPPTLNISSHKSAKDVASCIAEKWQNTKPFMALSSPQVSTTIKPDGYSVIATDINDAGGTSAITVADVTEIKLESAIKYYKLGFGLGNYDQAVTECQ